MFGEFEQIVPVLVALHTLPKPEPAPRNGQASSGEGEGLAPVDPGWVSPAWLADYAQRIRRHHPTA